MGYVPVPQDEFPEMRNVALQEAARIMGEALRGASRSLIGQVGWAAPKLVMLHAALVDGNVILWDDIRPSIAIHGRGNLVVFGAANEGELSGAVHGDGNIVYVAGGAPQIKLRVDGRGAGSFLYVGHRTKIVGGHIVFGATDPPTNILIGERCLISSKVILRATDSHGIFDLATEQVLNPPSDIVIEPCVWLGENTTMLKGACIGAGSIIGAGSLVTQSLPPRSVCAGVPARMIRSGVSWTPKPNPTIEEIRRQKRFLDKVSPVVVA